MYDCTTLYATKDISQSSCVRIHDDDGDEKEPGARQATNRRNSEEATVGKFLRAYTAGVLYIICKSTFFADCKVLLTNKYSQPGEVTVYHKVWVIYQFG